MDMRQAVVQHNVQIEHLDRVSWYQSLIQEWTGQVPQVFVQADGLVAAYVMGYHSQAGLVHVGATQVWSDSIENALDALSCQGVCGFASRPCACGEYGGCVWNGGGNGHGGKGFALVVVHRLHRKEGMMHHETSVALPC